MEFQLCQFHFRLCQIDMEKVGMGLFGAAVSARPIWRGRFGAETIRSWPIRRRDFSAQFWFFTTINAWLEYRAGANWVQCPERHTGIFFLNFFLENIKKVLRRVINVKKVPRRVRKRQETAPQG